MAKKINKTAEKIKEDAIKYYEYLTQNVRKQEEQLQELRKHVPEHKTTPKQRREIQSAIMHIMHDHIEIQALETILFRK